MAITAVLLDTNAYVAFKQGKQEALEIVQRTTQLALSSTVVGELLAGFVVGTREDKNRAELQQFLASRRIHVLTVDEGTAAYYAAVYRNLRGKGQPIPSNDMWIARLLHYSTAMRFLAMIATFNRWMVCLSV